MQLLRFFSFLYIYFSVSFYPIWMKILSKFRENVGLQAYRLCSVLNRSWTGLFRSFSKKLRGPGPLVRLNQLQSGLVLGPFPVLRTGPWSTRNSIKGKKKFRYFWCKNRVLPNFWGQNLIFWILLNWLVQILSFTSKLLYFDIWNLSWV